MSGPFAGRRIHFVGVGGAGLAAYARFCHQLGAEVSGSDRAPSAYSNRLEAEGILTLRVGHDPANLPPEAGVEVVHSTAVPPDNPELEAARARGLAVRSREALLAELTALRRTVVVGGTHGKTTTAAMVRRALWGAGIKAGWLIGGEPEPGLANGELGEADWLVVEGDESDRSLLALAVEVGVLTNVELDHAERFSSLLELRELFAAFLAKARAVAVWNRPELVGLVGAGPELRRYDAERIEVGRDHTSFWFGEREVRLAVVGVHNAHNAAAALAACELVGADLDAAICALADFPGAARRFCYVGRGPRGVAVYDDYAHHPSELRATLQAARARAGGGRVVAVFQPHLFSRTERFARELGEALAEADLAVCLEVYPAREDPARFAGISGLLVAAQAARAAGGREVAWAPTFEKGLTLLEARLRPGDLVVCAGAGDVDRLARELVARGDGRA